MRRTIIIVWLFTIVQSIDLNENSKLFKLWPKENKDWVNAKISKEKKQMFSQRFMKSEYYPDCEYELKTEPIYYYPGETIELKCRVCNVALILNGQPKRWAKIPSILEFLQKYKNIRTPRGPTTETIENYSFLGTQYDASILGKFYRNSKTSFLEVPEFMQTDGMLRIEKAHPKSMGVYYCFDDFSMVSQRFFYILIPMMPIVQKIPAELGICSVTARTGYPDFSWKDKYQPQEFDDQQTCFERYGKESAECIGKMKLVAINGCENPGSDCGLHFKMRNIPAKIHLKWSDWSPCAEQVQRRTGMCYLKLEKNLKPSQALADRDVWLMDFSKLLQIDGFHEGVPLNSGIIPMIIYKAKEFVSCIDEENSKIDSNDPDYKKKSESYSVIMRELLDKMAINSTETTPNGFRYCMSSKEVEDIKTTVGTYTIDTRKC